MPAITILGKLTTRPFASDDMHIACMILGVYRVIQFICLFPILAVFVFDQVKGNGLIINGVPSWCTQYHEFNSTYEGVEVPIFKEQIDIEYAPDYWWEDFVGNALVYFLLDVVWLIMVWRSSSIGTPTEPMSRDKYIRNLLKFKMFFSNLYPMALLGMGIYYVSAVRKNNYGCGNDGEPMEHPDKGAMYGLFCTLLVTYALELLIFPAMLTNKVIRKLKINRFWDRSRVEGRGGKAERFERRLGCMLKMLSYIAKGKAGGKELKNEGELKEFAAHVMCLLNNETTLELVLTDIYLGMRMLSLVQAEKKVEAIKKMSLKSKIDRKKSGSSDHQHNFNGRQFARDNEDELNSAKRIRRRSSIKVLQMKQGTYEICDREVLQEGNAFDETTMHYGAHFVKYASYIYVELPNCVIDEFVEGEEECSGFTRDLDTLFLDEFRLGSIGLEHSVLCYANFVNGIIATPYAILVDEEVKKIVIAVRGTRSLEDLVVDVQFVPESLAKVGSVCGFNGEGRYCHKGFLARSKWMYNDIKKNKILKTLYSQHSPYKDYPLVLCGHSLGAGCASILSLMLRPSFPSLMCFAYEPPGCIFDDKQSEISEEFITSFVRHDDLVPRLSYHNFESLRDGFFDAFARIKVPKIELFFHLREPYSERFVAVRNAKVLRAHEDILTTTEFNEKLEMFRAERAEKNKKGVNSVQLFIPGKIVHLVDTNGDGNYVSYWAGKRDFNQLEISKRMYADHDIHSLVGILQEGVRLGEENTVSLAFHNAPLIYDDNDRDASKYDIRLFACCSNPYGKLPIVLSLIGCIANTLAVISGTDCDFIHFSTTSLEHNNETIKMAFGVFSYGIRYCAGESCASLDDYVQECIPYPPKWTVDRYMMASRSFFVSAALLGGVGIFMTYVSMCFIYERRAWKIITVLLLLTTILEGLIFILIREFSSCQEPGQTCSLGTSAMEVIAACCLWFLMAIGSGYLAIVGKKSHLDEEHERGEEHESSQGSPSRPSSVS